MFGDDDSEPFDWDGMNTPAADDGMLDPASPLARFAQDLCEIFNTRPGRRLEAYLTEVAMTVTGLDALGQRVSQKQQDENEGRRILAIFLLGARADAARIRTEEEDTEK